MVHGLAEAHNATLGDQGRLQADGPLAVVTRPVLHRLAITIAGFVAMVIASFVFHQT